MLELVGRNWMEWTRSAVDILVVAYLIYRSLLVLRGTRAVQMGVGLGVLFVIFGVARLLQLTTLLSVMTSILSSIVLIIVVVFQNDIRRALIRMGSRAWLTAGRDQETKLVEEVVAAAQELARHRMGALIIFEQDASVAEFAKSEGFVLDADVTKELLVSLFVPESVNKLHDGAVLLRDHRIASAGVFLPMPESPKGMDASFGSRHRAALGITEETDAVVVVVSEERGSISAFFNGNVVPNLDGASLKQLLLGLFGRPTKPAEPAPVSKRKDEESVRKPTAFPPVSKGRPSVPPPAGAPSVAPPPPGIIPAAPKAPVISDERPLSIPPSGATSVPMPTAHAPTKLATAPEAPESGE